jgi:serine/threonine protein kinase
MMIFTRGGFSVVHECLSKRNGVKYAVKIYEKSVLVQHNQDYTVLLREVEVQSLITHDNIIKLYDIYETKKKAYFVMEM